MNITDRPTPETDEFSFRPIPFTEGGKLDYTSALKAWDKHARRLEQQRDALRDALLSMERDALEQLEKLGGDTAFYVRADNVKQALAAIKGDKP